METSGEARASDSTVPPPVSPPAAAPPPAPLGSPPRRGFPAAAGVVDSSGLIVGNVPCRRCSYDLHGLSVTGRCPECEAPVGVAVHGDLLRYGDPDWVRGLSRGAGFAFWGIFITIAAVVVGEVVAAMTVPLLAPLAAIAGGLVYLYGAWLLTEPDPSGLGEDRYGRSRQIIRVALLVGVLDSCLDAVIATTAPEPTVRVAFDVASFALALVDVVGEFAMLWYLQRLAMRIPDPGLAATARVTFWGYGVSLAAMVVFVGVAAIVGVASGSFGAGAPPPAGGVLGVMIGAGCVAAAAILAMLSFGIVFLVLLFRLRREFARQAALAREVWSAAPASLQVQQVLA